MAGYRGALSQRPLGEEAIEAEHGRPDRVRRQCTDVENHVIDEFLGERLARREFLRRRTIVGLSLPALAAVLAACGPSGTTDTTTSSGARGTTGATIRAGILVPTGAIDRMVVAFLPFATTVLAGALRSGHGLRTATVFYGVTFDATALTFNAVWQYACRHRLIKDTLDQPAATAIARRFQLALAWLAVDALLGLVIPFPGVAVIVAFNVFYWLPIRGESPRPRS